MTSHDQKLIDKINSLRSYGMNKSMWDRRDDAMPWSYAVSDLGHNFRMTDFQAALGMVQMTKLDRFTQIRRELVSRYEMALKKIPQIEFFEPEKQASPVFLYFAFKIRSGGESSLRNRLALFLIEKGIGASVHWDPPLHQHPLFSKNGLTKENFKVTEALSREVVSLPLFPAMTGEDVDYIVEKVSEFFSC